LYAYALAVQEMAEIPEIHDHVIQLVQGDTSDLLNERMDVRSGGQAVVGMVATPGGGGSPKLEDQPHAKQIAYAPQPPMWSAEKEREPVPIARDAERPVPTARRKVAGRSQG
jgi:hypothetical protein